MVRIRYTIALSILVAFILAPVHHHNASLDAFPEATAAKSCGICLLHGKIAIEVGNDATVYPQTVVAFVTVVADSSHHEPELRAPGSRAPPAD